MKPIQITDQRSLKELLPYSKIKDVARCSGVSQSTIENWVYNGIQPGLYNIVAVLQCAGYDVIASPYAQDN